MSLGHEECARLTKYHNITGKEISVADDEYMEGTLGILEFSLKQKLKYEILKYKETTWSEINLWGWGSNLHGQLGT